MFDAKTAFSRDKWVPYLQSLSKPYHKYGSFLPEQLELFEGIYEKLEKSERPVWIFTAPPASGKTHVICLLARALTDTSNHTAIVVPNNHLKEEFNEGRKDVYGDLPKVDVLSLSEYVRTNKQYDFVLVDEAHNLKSFLELDTNIVRRVDLTRKDKAYYALSSRYLPYGKEFVARQLSFPSTADMLKILAHVPKLRRQLSPVLRDPTSWLCFIYIWKNLDLCSLKFVNANGICKLRFPKKHLLLFTATPLSDTELGFYCGIPSDAIERACVVKPSSTVSEKQRVCISVEENLPFEDKMTLIRRLVQESNTRTLILFNNVVSCQKTHENLKDLRNIFMIPSYSKDRPTILKAFLNADCGVLLTSSTVFWEGITIKNLRLLVIVEPPYPRPRLIELMRRKVTDGRTDMRRRLLQGLGRISRRKGESGIVITLFDPIIANSESVRKEFRKMKADECSRVIHELLTKNVQ